MRLCLLLLPVWLAGAGELGRFVWLNTSTGPYERNGFVKGRDFVQFYVAGTLAREGAWDVLYNVPALEAAVARVVPPATGEIPAPLYGPQVAAFFAPWSRLPYLQARWWWCIASICLYITAAAIVMRHAPGLQAHRALAWMTIGLNPSLALLLSTGQTGALAMLAWALATIAFSRGRLFLFGAALGLLAFKPPLLIGAIPVLVLLGMWSALFGLAVSVVSQVVVSLPFTGLDSWMRYASAVANMPAHYYLTDTLPHQKQSLIGFFQLLLGSEPAAAASATLAAAAVLALWWRHRHQECNLWLLPMLAATTVLLSPHFYVYDLVLLVPALLVTGEKLATRCETSREQMVAWTGYALLYAPFSGALAQESRIQLSTIVMTMFAVAVHRQWISTGMQDREEAP